MLSPFWGSGSASLHLPTKAMRLRGACFRSYFGFIAFVTFSQVLFGLDDFGVLFAFELLRLDVQSTSRLFHPIYCDGERSRTKTAMSETQKIMHSPSLHYFSCVHLHLESTAVIADGSRLLRIADRSPLLQWRHVQSLMRLIPGCSPDSKNG